MIRGNQIRLAKYINRSKPIINIRYNMSNQPEIKMYTANNGNYTYYMENGKKVLHGPYIVYYPNGKLKMATYFDKGKQSGKYIEYDEAGNTTREYMYANNYKNGPHKYYEDG